jgi:hypothetical protein
MVTTDVAIVNVRTARIVAHAILDPGRISNASRKLKKLDAHCKSHNTEPSGHVQTALTVQDLVQQLKDCQIRSNDWMFEYSTFKNSLDVRNLRHLLKFHGYNEQELVPAENTGSIVPAVQQLLKNTLGLDSIKLPFLFRILFPSDPFVDLNHSAAVDTMQLVQIFRLLAALLEPPEKRRLPSTLFQGLNELFKKNFEPQSNTLDKYLTVLDDPQSVMETIPEGTGETIEMDENETVGLYDQGDEDNCRKQMFLNPSEMWSEGEEEVTDNNDNNDGVDDECMRFSGRLKTSLLDKTSSGLDPVSTGPSFQGIEKKCNAAGSQDTEKKRKATAPLPFSNKRQRRPPAPFAGFL